VVLTRHAVEHLLHTSGRGRRGGGSGRRKTTRSAVFSPSDLLFPRKECPQPEFGHRERGLAVKMRAAKKLSRT
jgi:hypothetical protein